MPSIADSDAVLDISRILPQHQSALTLLNGKLQKPGTNECNWLDLACGKGQIISQLSENLSTDNRRKLAYAGYDINVDHTRIAERMASDLGFKSHSFRHGDLSQFAKLLEVDEQFDFVTCTNTAHELQPGAFATIVIDALLRLSDSGEFFVYDMESLVQPELGALPWRGDEIGALLNELFEVLDTEFRVHPSTWQHSTCKGWTVVIQRAYLNKSNIDITGKRSAIEEKLETAIDKILATRLQQCDATLNSYAKWGTDTADDERTKLAALYEFWALHNAIKVRA
jgi:SAM-dependent methyltransferase